MELHAGRRAISRGLVASRQEFCGSDLVVGEVSGPTPVSLPTGHPLSLLLRTTPAGPHVYVQVFAGFGRDRALCGNVTFRRPEWEALQPALATMEGIDLRVEGKDGPA